MIEPIRVSRRVRRASSLLCLLGLACPGLANAQAQATGLAGYFQDASIPASGELWFQVTPALLNWSEQFALDSPDPKISDGDREPLFVNFDGLLRDRFFPDFSPLLDGLNADAAALGFDPVAAEDFSLGSLVFTTLDTQVRRADIGLEFGLGRRLALEARAPLVMTRVAPTFAFDSLLSGMVTGVSVVPAPDTYFDAFETALGSLQSLIDGGTLSPEEQATATALLSTATGFRDALFRRVTDNQIVPVGPSTAGTQMAGHYQSLSQGFTAFGLSIPDLALPKIATSLDLDGFFTADPVSGLTPTTVERGLAVGEVELGIRFGLFDTFASPDRASGTETDEAADPSAGGERVDPEAETPDPRTVRLRTTIGAKARIPIRSTGRPPLDVPADYLDLGIADGQPDFELAVFQDIAVRRFLLLAIQARYGLQLADELTLRVDSPDQRYSLASSEARVERNLGDYLWLRASPQLRLTQVLSVGLEYSYWHKGTDRYTIASGAAVDAASLELKTSQTRHRLGIGAFYRLADGDDRASPRPAWMFGFIFQTAIAGSGGRTPASQLVTFTLRIPIRIL